MLFELPTSFPLPTFFFSFLLGASFFGVYFGVDKKRAGTLKKSSLKSDVVFFLFCFVLHKNKNVSRNSTSSHEPFDTDSFSRYSNQGKSRSFTMIVNRKIKLLAS